MPHAPCPMLSDQQARYQTKNPLYVRSTECRLITTTEYFVPNIRHPRETSTGHVSVSKLAPSCGTHPLLRIPPFVISSFFSKSSKLHNSWCQRPLSLLQGGVRLWGFSWFPLQAPCVFREATKVIDVMCSINRSNRLPIERTNAEGAPQNLVPL